MAEGFARCYGSDVLEAASAGLAPAGIVVSETIRTMHEVHACRHPQSRNREPLSA
jgi:hypothetical protein